MKIGITLSLKDINESIWTNGIKLNLLYLIDVLKNSKKNYELYILNVKDIEIPEELPSHFKDVNIRYFDDVYQEMDLIIMLGAQMKGNLLSHFKSLPNKKVVAYKCGNNYIISAEKMIFKDGFKTTEYDNEFSYDEIWYVPQQHDTNCGYFRTFHRTDALIVPFVWHYKFVKETLVEVERNYKLGKYKKDHRYQIGKKVKSIGIMEPNINLVKFCVIPIFIAEESYRGEGKELISNVYVGSSDGLNKKQNFIQLIKSLDLFKDKKITSESRYRTPYFLSQFIDVLVCHQLLNPLNYIYLDAAYMGYPVLHNAELCKDLGYYYNGSNTEEGGKLLNYILKEHDNHIEEYDERNDKVLNRYFSENEDVVSMYDLLIENLFNNIPNTYLKYNPDTNLYDNYNEKKVLN